MINNQVIINILMISSIFLSSCNKPQEGFDNVELSNSRRAEILMTYEITNQNFLDEESEYMVFRAFPEDYTTFNILFCKKHPTKDGRLLYLTRTFFLMDNLYYVPESDVLEKFFNISLEANVADDCETLSKGTYAGHFSAVENFQKVVQRKFANHTDLAVELIQEKTDRNILDFWKFYFDGIHPTDYKGDFKVLYDRYSRTNKRVADLMDEAFKRLITEDG